MAAAKVRNKSAMRRLSASVSELLGGRKAKEELDEAMASLRHAVTIGNAALLRMLLQNPALNLEQVDSKGCGPLHWAAVSGSTRELVTILLRAGLDPDVQDTYGNSALHLAAKEGNVEATAALVGDGADAGLLNHQLKTPFDVAAEFGRLALLELLVESDAGPRLLSLCSPDPFRPGTSALHLAARNGRCEVVEWLLRRGADLDESTEAGTALHEAAIHCQVLPPVTAAVGIESSISAGHKVFNKNNKTMTILSDLGLVP